MSFSRENKSHTCSFIPCSNKRLHKWPFCISCIKEAALAIYGTPNLEDCLKTPEDKQVLIDEVKRVLFERERWRNKQLLRRY